MNGFWRRHTLEHRVDWYITKSDVAYFCNMNNKNMSSKSPDAFFWSHLSSQIDVNQATDLIRLKEFVSRILKQKVLQLIWCFRFYWKHRRLTVFILSWICLRWLIYLMCFIPAVLVPDAQFGVMVKQCFAAGGVAPCQHSVVKRRQPSPVLIIWGRPQREQNLHDGTKEKENLRLKPLLNSDSNDKDKLLG